LKIFLLDNKTKNKNQINQLLEFCEENLLLQGQKFDQNIELMAKDGFDFKPKVLEKENIEIEGYDDKLKEY